jgi:cytochrome c553
MTVKHIPTVFGALVALAALAAPANAAPAAPEHAIERPALPTPGNTAEAQVILGAKLLVCSTCHGGDGVPRSGGTPIIWGLQENYLAKQLHDFQTGDRANDVMTWMATAISDAELAPVAAYFANKNWPARSAAAPASSASPPAAAAVCQACHQQNLVGGLAAPRLAGQRYDYLVETMRRYAEGERTNNPVMTSIMQAIAPADREAMARYISGL